MEMYVRTHIYHQGNDYSYVKATAELTSHLPVIYSQLLDHIQDFTYDL